MPGACVNDMACSLADSCTCQDCWADSVCADPSKSCADDGVCDPYLEGCICTDCIGDPLCASYPGPGSICVADTPPACTAADACVCSDCWTDQYCTNPLYCTNDGFCNGYNEGCHCMDCAADPLCMGFPGGMLTKP